MGTIYHSILNTIESIVNVQYLKIKEFNQKFSHSDVKTPTDRVAHVFAATSVCYLFVWLNKLKVQLYSK